MMSPPLAPQAAVTRPGSLRRRLLLAAAAWIALALLVVALVLTALFRQHVEAELADRMQAQLDHLIGALQLAPDAVGTNAAATSPGALSRRVSLDREPAEPGFRQPYSGLYWAVQQPDGSLLRSRSLWDHPLDLPWSQAPADGIGRLPVAGPRGQSLVFWTRRVQLPGLDAPVTVASGADVSHLERTTRSFTQTLAASLAALFVGLMAAAWLQVHLGLAPLRTLREALGRLRSGQAQQLGGHHPAEVQPLVDDLDALLTENAAIVDNARSQTGNLAHALKTPLAVMGNAVATMPGADGALLRSQLAQMHRQVELHLARARAAAVARATTRSHGPGTPVRPVIDELLQALGRLHAERGLHFDVREPADAAAARIRGDAHELQEMLGNLLDNACKWARSRVRIDIERDTAGSVPMLFISVGDDGPGIPASERDAVLQRGTRLDESRPGSGLGLAIADDLARLHGGSLRLGESALGGLDACLRLPAHTAPPHPFS